MRRWKHFISGNAGAEIAEAALVLPLVFMLLLGIFWFGRVYNIYSTVTHAAQEGARAASSPTCATCPASACNWATSSFPCDTTVVNAVGAALQASSLPPSQVGIYTPPYTLCPGLDPAAQCTVSGNVTVCRGVRMNVAGSSLPECGVQVSFKYPYQFYFPFTSLNFQLVNLPASAERRMEF